MAKLTVTLLVRVTEKERSIEASYIVPFGEIGEGPAALQYKPTSRKK
jgi:hypothetical protein